MKLSKILFYLLVLVILVIPALREKAVATVHSVVIHSGFVNPSMAETKKETFNYEFSVRDLSGKEIDFRSFRGKAIFLNLWATWCGPCRSEMASIQELYNETKENSVTFVMLSLDDERRTQRVKSYISSQGFSFPVFVAIGQLTDQLDVGSIPTTFVIDKDGYIVMKEVGMRNYNTPKFKKYIESLSGK